MGQTAGAALKNFICFDDIIYSLQKFGGMSTYWTQMTSKVERARPGQVEHVRSRYLGRLSRPRTRAQVFHSSHFRVPSSEQVFCVATVHDLTYELGLVGGLGRHMNLFERKRSVLRADHIICISESTRRDLLEYYGNLVASKPIDVIYHGPTIDQNEGHLDDDLLVPDVPYFLYVGNRSGYKNFNCALNAFRALIMLNNHAILICTGSPFSNAEIELIKNLKLGTLVQVLPYISQSQLALLYRHAIGLVYPSRHEGFGMPVLDAMASGCPVVASNTSSIPEICDGAGLLCNPNDHESFTEAMLKLLDWQYRLELKRRGLLRSKKFSWDFSAQSHLTIYENLS